MSKTTKLERIEQMNKIMACIGSLGREFFHKDTQAYFYIADSGRLHMKDSYCKEPIKSFPEYKRWRNFSNGGTMKNFVLDMVDYIRNGKTFYQYNGMYCWGESEETQIKIANSMIENKLFARVKTKAGTIIER